MEKLYCSGNFSHPCPSFQMFSLDLLKINNKWMIIFCWREESMTFKTGRKFEKLFLIFFPTVHTVALSLYITSSRILLHRERYFSLCSLCPLNYKKDLIPAHSTVVSDAKMWVDLPGAPTTRDTPLQKETRWWWSTHAYTPILSYEV